MKVEDNGGRRQVFTGAFCMYKETTQNKGMKINTVMCVCVCAYMTARERETEREIERDTWFVEIKKSDFRRKIYSLMEMCPM